MLIRPDSLESPKMATAIVDTDLALKHRIETLAALVSALVAEVDRLRAELSPPQKYLRNHNSEADFRQASINDEGIDFYREIELYEIELIKRALQRVRGCQRRAAELLGLNPTTLNAKIKHFATNGFDLTLFVRNMADRQGDWKSSEHVDGCVWAKLGEALLSSETFLQISEFLD
jgi:DNA-binding protein Fis